ncbi:MAG: hypothetical protein GQE15_04245 [Archangiaceae bacterium]|nr:hypothetical protein [Archangiaceae bacterium]
MRFFSSVVVGCLLASGCSCSTAQTRLVSPDGKATLTIRCATERALQGDVLPHLVTHEVCRGAWQVEGWAHQPSFPSFDGKRTGMYVAIDVDPGRHLVAATRDRRQWDVWFVDGKTGAYTEAVPLERDEGTPLGLAAVDLDSLVADTFVRKTATFRGFWRLREGDAAVEALYARGAARDDDLPAAWVGAVRELPPEAVERVTALVREEVRTRPTLASVFHLLALDERGPANDPSLRASVWAVAMAAAREKAVTAGQVTPESLAASNVRRQRQLALMRTLLAGDGFGAQPEAGALACALVEAGERLPHVVLGLARAAERGERCAAADAAWFDKTQDSLSCIDLDDVPVDGFAGVCDATWRGLKLTMPVADGVTRGTTYPSSCLKAEFGVQVWSLKRELGFGDRPSRLDRLAYRFDVDAAIDSLDRGRLARTVCGLEPGEPTARTIGGSKVLVDDAKKTVRVVAEGH